MTFLSRSTWFWQTELSPHVAGLARALEYRGCDVTFVAGQLVSQERAGLGWQAPDTGNVRTELASTSATVESLVASAAPNTIHICQGLRGNGLVGTAQRALARRGLPQWVLMETVDDAGWLGALRALEYRRLLMQWRNRLEGVLAIGYRSPGWIASRGMPAARVFPFAYFLSATDLPLEPARVAANRFRFVFVGRLAKIKGLDLLLSALATLKNKDIELEVIGSGPLEAPLRSAADAALPGRVTWAGRLPMNQVPTRVAAADCLVLPSHFDGWGAATIEALMVGTPAICSDRCGSAGVVSSSGAGWVFPAGDRRALSDCLAKVIARGRLSRTERSHLAHWAQRLGADSGARYLIEVLDYVDGRARRPSPPWLRAA